MSKSVTDKKSYIQTNIILCSIFSQEDVKNVDVDQEMEKLQKMMQEKKAGTLDNVSENELEQYAKEVPEDKVYKKFSKRVARHPDQVLRYDRGGDPLWITGHSNALINIPPCQYCSSERQFEFQVQSLYILIYSPSL